MYVNGQNGKGVGTQLDKYHGLYFAKNTIFAPCNYDSHHEAIRLQVVVVVHFQKHDIINVHVQSVVVHISQRDIKQYRIPLLCKLRTKLKQCN